MELLEQLRSSLGASYTLDRELGGGGMSRVFVAEETALGRKVVVKVLRPDLAEGLSADRFKREIVLAAQLQQANIVPVLSAGVTQPAPMEAGGLPYYTMPLVDGESLRSRLRRAGALPIAEATRVVEDVAKALAYAHARGVVHRDIKPDNVLLSGGTAVVTDFGIAKAISAARTGVPNGSHPGRGEQLTIAGTSIGTPAYMSPEQAAGDPDVDHRADLYSLGVLAYELLAGRPPFDGMPPHRLLASHMTVAPAPLTDHRPDCPSALAALVMRLLAKDPDERPPSAAAVVQALAGIAATPSGGGYEALPAISLATRRTLRRALAIYAGAFVAVAIVARAAVVGIGLPDWVFPAALVVMALGLPAVLFTAFVQHGARVARTTRDASATMTRLAVRASPHVSWRRTVWSGGLALGALALLVTGYMTLRALGIGPAGSLFSKGVLAEQERLLVADFGVAGADSSLGSVFAEGLRTTLNESRVVSVVPTSVVLDALRRMQRPPNARLDLALARQLAQREGIRAVVDGSVTPLGGTYVLTARLIAAGTGDELTSYQTTADAKEFIGGIDRVGRRLREKIGESLKTVRADPPLEHVTTASLDALRKYSEASSVARSSGNWDRATQLLREAVAIDTGFASAYRLLAVTLSQAHTATPAEQRAITLRAYEHRDRLPEAERLAAVAYHYQMTDEPDRLRAIATYDTLLRRYPVSWDIPNLYGVLLSRIHQYTRSEAAYRRAIQLDPRVPTSRANLAASLMEQGRQREARAVLDQLARDLPRATEQHDHYVYGALWLEGKFDSATTVATHLAASANGQYRATGLYDLTNLAIVRGHLREGLRLFAQARTLDSANGRPANALTDSILVARLALWLQNRPAETRRRLDAALARTPLGTLPVDKRPYLRAASLYAILGQIDRARALLAQHDAAVTDRAQRWTDAPQRHETLAWIALAEGRPRDAVTEFRLADRLPDGLPLNECAFCADANVGLAFDRAGMRDSAIATFEHFLRTPYSFRGTQDIVHRASILRRLGELYEDRGDRASAASCYARFVELWKDADPDLQPQVRAARQRLALLGTLDHR